MQIWSLILLFLVPSVYSFDGKEDRSLEKRLHSIYRSSYSTEVSDQDWANYVEKIENNTYRVRSGDTLWGLSRIFFGDGFFWSKIWSYNDKVTNPHMISIGTNLDFFSGSLANPPSMSVNGGKAQTGTMVISKSSSEGQDLYPDAPDLPPSVTPVPPVLSLIPPVFSSVGSKVNHYNPEGVSFDIRPPIHVSTMFTPHSFIYSGDNDYPNFGKVIEGEDNQAQSGWGQKIYISSSQGLSMGQKFTIVGKDYKLSRLGSSGQVMQYMGEGIVQDVMEGGVYRATLVRSIRPVRLGAGITFEKIPSFPDNGNGRNNSTSVEIVGGSFDNQREYFGRGSIVFLNGGGQSGLSVNDILGVYKIRDRRYFKNEVDVSPSPIAKIKVFRVESELASAFVVESSEAIVVGDKTGAPRNLNSVVPSVGSSSVEPESDIF